MHSTPKIDNQLTKAPLLKVRDLKLSFSTSDGTVNALNSISFDLNEGETLGIVGESGAGKSQIAMALMGLLPNNSLVSGSAQFLSQELLYLNNAQMRKLRAKKIAMVFQDPMTALNPYLPIGIQLTEVLEEHEKISRSEATKRAVQMLDAVKLPDAAKRMKHYPHEFSGGMRQRVMIAMSLLCHPKLLIADEPTTALDVTVQAQILNLLAQLQKDFSISILIITHDLSVVAQICDHVAVVYAGRIMESATTKELLTKPKHPYTKALLSSIPRIDHEQSVLPTIVGSPPNLLYLPSGCAFKDRCPNRKPACEKVPDFTYISKAHYVACHCLGK